MDEKEKSKGEKYEVPFEGKIEIDPSSVVFKDDGSMSEPSFHSDKEENNEQDIIEEIPDSDDEGIEKLSDNDKLEESSKSEEDGVEEALGDDDIIDDNESESNPYEESSSSEDGGGEEFIDSNEQFEDTSSESGESSEESSSETISPSENTSESSESTSSESETTNSKSEPVSEGGETITDDKTSGSNTESLSDSKDSSTETSDTSDNSSNPSSDSDSLGKESTTDNQAGNDDLKETTSGDNKKSDSKSEKSDGKSDKKSDNKADNNKPDGKDSNNAADNVNKAKDATKDAAKDAGNTAKDAAKDAAKEGAQQVGDAAKDVAKEGAKEAAKEGAKEAPVLDKADMAKNAASDTKDIAKGGLKEAVKADKQRHAIDAASNFTPWGKIAKGVLKASDAIIGSDNTDKILDFIGSGSYKSAMAGLVVGIIGLLVPLFFLVIAIYMVFAPMLDALMSVKEVAINLADTAEKFTNLYMNGRFGDSKETFYVELDRLGKIYGEELDSTLLLAATFYTDMKNGYQTDYSDVKDVMNFGVSLAKDIDESDVETYTTNFAQLIKTEMEELKLESEGTYDESTGFWYTVGKIYRLKLLANGMFSKTLGGSESDYTAKDISLGDWIDLYGGQFKGELATVMKDVFTDVGKTAAISVAIGIPLPPFLSKKTLLDAKILINCLLLGCMSIKSITLPATGFSLDSIKINYYSYKFNEDNFRKYLKEDYIPNNPDFKPFLSYDADGNPLEKSIDMIIDEIFEYKMYFDGLFLEQEEDYSEDYDDLCIGAIDRRLASALSSPTDISTSSCIEFLDKNGYGYTTDGKLHNGIELNKDSTGNVEGDKVYAVLDGGIVKQSSADSSMELQCTGGCIEIGYKYTIGGTTTTEFDFSIIYKGLSKKSVTLKKGDTVTDHQEVGKIGTTAESEGMSVPSLYLEFKKLDGTVIDPTNLIVKCRAHVDDYPGATTITIPQSFTQANKYSFTCMGGKGWYAGCSASQERYWGVGNGQKATYEVWASQGSKYKNGIAYITVDGVDRYLVAVVPQIGNPGDVLNAKFKDGSVAPLVVQDVKGEGVNDTGWGHDLDGATNVIEFQVQLDHPTDNVNTSGWGIEWESSNNPVVAFTNNGNIHNGSFDLKGGSGTSTQATADGIKLCDSMYYGNKTGAIANKAIQIANDNAIGNTTTANRTLNPDVDNASLIYYSVVNSGVMKGQDSVFTIDEMENVLVNNYFTKMDYKEGEIKKGDILVYEKDSKKIAVIYIGEDKQVFADPSKANDVAGDANGDEVLITAFDKTLSYKAVYRYDYEKQYGPLSKNSINFLVSKSSLFSY